MVPKRSKSCSEECKLTAQVYELIDKGSAVSQLTLVRYHFVDPTGVADPEVLRSDYVTDVLPHLCAATAAGYSHTSTILRKVYPTAELQSEAAISPVQVGARSSNIDSTANTYRVKWTIGATTYLVAESPPVHIKRGGKHIGGCADGDFTLNNITSSTVTAALNAWITALLAVTSDSWLLCVASFYDNVHTKHETVQKYALVTGGIIGPVGTQNTRKPGRGK
jgi:hypothetical protein